MSTALKASLLALSVASLSHVAHAGGGCATPQYAPAQSVAAPLHVDGNAFKDAQGRTVLLRGVNAPGNAKMPPFATLTDASMLDPLPRWGLNTIRLLFTWEAFEPNRCSYNGSYLDYYEQVVRWAEQRGIYVIVDFHQDAYSRYSVSGCGEGFPKWAVASWIAKKTPDNGPNCADWGTKMIVDLSHHMTWRAFHRDYEGAQSRYLDMVRAVAQRMSQRPNVIGYELMNEPWGTDGELLAMFNRIGPAIRERHPNAILFVPPHALVSSGLLDDNIGTPSFGNYAYSPHNYDGMVMMLKQWLGTSPNGPLDKLRNKANSRGVPMLLSEFGASGPTQNAAGYMEAMYDWLDANLVSATQWTYTPGWTDAKKDGWNMEDFSIVDDKGQLRTQLFVPRPYPQKTAGTPIGFKRGEAGLSYRWHNAPEQGATELYLPEGYPQQLSLSVNGVEVNASMCSFALRSLRCEIPQAGEVALTVGAP